MTRWAQLLDEDPEGRLREKTVRGRIDPVAVGRTQCASSGLVSEAGSGRRRGTSTTIERRWVTTGSREGKV